jgi:hypothetical protein
MDNLMVVCLVVIFYGFGYLSAWLNGWINDD